MSLSFNDGEDKKLICTIYDKKIKKHIYITSKNYDFDKSTSNEKNDIKKIVLENKESFIFPYITDKDNERIYISGKSGSGKTYNFIRPYIINFLNKFKSNVYYFSSKMKDNAVDDLDIIRVEPDYIENKELLISDFTTKNKKNLIVFDDIQDYKTKKLNEKVAQFRNEVLRNGRSEGLYILYVNHKPNAGFQTAEQIFEATAVVIFPKQSGESDYNLMMSKYLGIKPKEMEILKNAKSKYVYISKSKPAYAISDNYVLSL